MIIRKRIVSLFLATTLLVPLAQITPLKAESDSKEVDVMFTIRILIWIVSQQR